MHLYYYSFWRQKQRCFYVLGCFYMFRIWTHNSRKKYYSARKHSEIIVSNFLCEKIWKNQLKLFRSTWLSQNLAQLCNEKLLSSPRSFSYKSMRIKTYEVIISTLSLYIAGLFSCQVILFRFSPTLDCVSLPRLMHNLKWLKIIGYSYLFNLRANICKSWCFKTPFIPNDSALTL